MTLNARCLSYSIEISVVVDSWMKADNGEWLTPTATSLVVPTWIMTVIWTLFLPVMVLQQRRNGCYSRQRGCGSDRDNRSRSVKRRPADPHPDPPIFEALEQLITKVHLTTERPYASSHGLATSARRLPWPINPTPKATAQTSRSPKDSPRVA